MASMTSNDVYEKLNTEDEGEQDARVQELETQLQKATEREIELHEYIITLQIEPEKLRSALEASRRDCHKAREELAELRSEQKPPPPAPLPPIASPPPPPDSVRQDVTDSSKPAPSSSSSQASKQQDHKRKLVEAMEEIGRLQGVNRTLQLQVDLMQKKLAAVNSASSGEESSRKGAPSTRGRGLRTRLSSLRLSRRNSSSSNVLTPTSPMSPSMSDYEDAGNRRDLNDETRILDAIAKLESTKTICASSAMQMKRDSLFAANLFRSGDEERRRPAPLDTSSYLSSDGEMAEPMSPLTGGGVRLSMEPTIAQRRRNFSTERQSGAGSSWKNEVVGTSRRLRVAEKDSDAADMLLASRREGSRRSMDLDRRGNSPVRESVDDMDRKQLSEEDQKLLATFDFEAWKAEANRLDKEKEGKEVEDDAEKLWLEVQKTAEDEKKGAGKGSKEINVKVAVRVRPFIERERKLDCKACVSMEDQGKVIVQDPAEHKQPFERDFDYAFWSHDPLEEDNFVSQRDVFLTLGKDLMQSIWSGYNCAVFAYGQTGSGKTYTMQGTDDDPGFNPRIGRTLFHFMDNEHRRFREKEERLAEETKQPVEPQSIHVQACFYEIYNEKVNDLLTKGPEGQDLKIREHPDLGAFVDGIKWCEVATHGDINTIIEEGNRNRTVASTNMNKESSRSHSVLSLKVSFPAPPTVNKKKKPSVAAASPSPGRSTGGRTSTSGKGGRGKKQVDDSRGRSPPRKSKASASRGRTSKVALVDLAGSERAFATGAQGARLREGSNINKSLSTLGRCVAALVKAQKQISSKTPASPAVDSKDKKKGSTAAAAAKQNTVDAFVPFRESALTHLLKDALFGNARTTLIASVSPADVNYGETMSTLRFCLTVKQIKTKPVVNEDETVRLLSAMTDEIEALKKHLEEAAKAGSLLQQQYISTRLASSVSAMTTLDTAYDTNAYSNMSQLRQDRAKHTVAFGFSSTSDHNQELHLKQLSDEWTLVGRVVVTLGAGDVFRIGRDDSLDEQDLQLGGIGIAPRHCSLSIEPISEEEALKLASVGEPVLRATKFPESPSRANVGGSALEGVEEFNDDDDEDDDLLFDPNDKPKAKGSANVVGKSGEKVYVRVKFDSFATCYVNGRPVPPGESLYLKHNDRVVLGPCTHLFTLIDPTMMPHDQPTSTDESQPAIIEPAKPELGGVMALVKEKHPNIGIVPTYEMAVREVLLRESESSMQRGERLMHMVMSRWRMPLYRRLFEEDLVNVLQGVAEANEISHSLRNSATFVVRLGCELPQNRVLTLNYVDLVPYNQLRIHVVCYIPSESTDNPSTTVSRSGVTKLPMSPRSYFKTHSFSNMPVSHTHQPSNVIIADDDLNDFSTTEADPLGEELFAVDAVNFEHVLVHLRDTYTSLQSVMDASTLDDGRSVDDFFDQIFHGIDTNKDGTLSFEEAARGFAAAGIAANELEVEGVFRQFDVDNSGTLDKKEFRDGVIETVRNRFAATIAPYVVDKRRLISAGYWKTHAGIHPVFAAALGSSLDTESVQAILQDKIQEIADLTEVLERTSLDTGVVSEALAEILQRKRPRNFEESEE